MRRPRLLDICHPGAFFTIQYVFYFGLGVFLYFIDLVPFYVDFKSIFLIFVYILFFWLACYGYSEFFIGKRAIRLRKITNYNISVYKAYYLCSFTVLLSISILGLVHLSNGFIPVLGGDNVNALRVQSMVGKGRFVIPSFSLLYICNCILVVIYPLLNNRFKKISVIFLLILSFISILSFGFRSPAFYLLITVFILKLSLGDKYQNKIGISKGLVFVFSIAVIGIIISGLVRDGVSIFNSNIIGLFYAFSVNLFNLNEIVEFYPQHYDYLYGYSLINDVKAVIPGLDGEFLGNYLKDALQLDFDGSSISVTAIGEGYVNLGLLGVILHSSLLGIIAGISYNQLGRRNTVWSRLFLVIFSLSFGRIVTGGISAIFFFSILPNIILLLFFFFLLKRGSYVN